MNKALRSTRTRKIVGKRQFYRRVAKEIENVSVSSVQCCSQNYSNFVDVASTSTTLNEVAATPPVQSLKASVNDLNFETPSLSYPPIFVAENLIYNADDDDENSFPPVSSLVEDLRMWAIINKITHTALTGILRILKPLHPELPTDARTLLATPRRTEIKKIGPDDFTYLGILEGITNSLSFTSSKNLNVSCIELSFNIDGLPLFKSSSLQLWPILGLIKNIKGCKPFVIALFSGKSKPCDLNLYFKEFIEELKLLLRDGVHFEDKFFLVKVHSFVCDAPAKAFIKCIKSHSGYSSCDKCMVVGDYIDGRVVLNSLSDAKRTDQSFIDAVDHDHHIGKSPLENLGIGMVSKFPVDYMHACCLGVCKKMLVTWTTGPLNTRFSARQTQEISENLLLLRKYTPLEINRKPRSLSELSRWKATEFRSFFLYVGPVILKDLVDIAVYEHFLLFHFSLTILLCENYITTFSTDLPHHLLSLFITHSERLYGKQFIIYNVHILSHLHDEAKRYGSLDNISSFPFESYLGYLKSLVKSPNKPLQQIHRRIREYELAQHQIKDNDQCVIHQSIHLNGPTLNIQNCVQFKYVGLNNFVIKIYSQSVANCYFQHKNGKICQVENILVKDNKTYLIARPFRSADNFYTYPYQSSSLRIFVVKDLLEDLECFSIEDIKHKCILFPYKERYVALPLIHTTDK